MTISKRLPNANSRSSCNDTCSFPTKNLAVSGICMRIEGQWRQHRASIDEGSRAGNETFCVFVSNARSKDLGPAAAELPTTAEMRIGQKSRMSIVFLSTSGVNQVPLGPTI